MKTYKLIILLIICLLVFFNDTQAQTKELRKIARWHNPIQEHPNGILIGLNHEFTNKNQNNLTISRVWKSGLELGGFFQHRESFNEVITNELYSGVYAGYRAIPLWKGASVYLRLSYRDSKFMPDYMKDRVIEMHCYLGIAQRVPIGNQIWEGKVMALQRERLGISFGFGKYFKID